MVKVVSCQAFSFAPITEDKTKEKTQFFLSSGYGKTFYQLCGNTIAFRPASELLLTQSISATSSASKHENCCKVHNKVAIVSFESATIVIINSAPTHSTALLLSALKNKETKNESAVRPKHYNMTHKNKIENQEFFTPRLQSTPNENQP